MSEVNFNDGAMIFFAVFSVFLVDAYLVAVSNNKFRDIFISIFFWIVFLIVLSVDN